MDKSAIYYMSTAFGPDGCYGEPDRELLRLDWYRDFSNKHRAGKVDDWMLEYFPQVVTVDPSEYKLKDVIGTNIGYCVSSRTKDIIEQIEPSTHQFIPVEINYGKRQLKYYILRLGLTEDCCSLEKSDVKWKTLNVEGRNIRIWYKKTNIPLVFLNSKIYGKNLFQSKSGTRMTLISKQLHDVFESNGITGLLYEEQLVI